MLLWVGILVGLDPAVPLFDSLAGVGNLQNGWKSRDEQLARYSPIRDKRVSRA